MISTSIPSQNANVSVECEEPSCTHVRVSFCMQNVWHIQILESSISHILNFLRYMNLMHIQTVL